MSGGFFDKYSGSFHLGEGTVQHVEDLSEIRSLLRLILPALVHDGMYVTGAVSRGPHPVPHLHLRDNHKIQCVYNTFQSYMYMYMCMYFLLMRAN